MNVFVEVSQSILMLLPQLILNPAYALIFWVLVLFVGLQYRKMAATERRLYGQVLTPVFQRLGSALLFGVVGGVAGSYLLVFTGVSLGRTDIAYLWPVAILLMLIHPRFICFSYAAGLVSLSHLFIGWPVINVTGLIGLVAILHIVEAVLVYFSGDHGATPLYLRHHDGAVVGGFSLQRFWPVPIVILLMLALPEQLQGGSIDMPGWWPLITPSGSSFDLTGLELVMFPVAAALGYGDMAVTMSPQRKSRRTAVHLFYYSSTVLALAVLASHWPPGLWLAALAAPGLHELMIQAGMRSELQGPAYYRHPGRGVVVLDVLRGGHAERMGLRRGDWILTANGDEIHSRADLNQVLSTASFYLELTGRRGSDFLQLQTNRFRFGPAAFGMIPVPQADDAAHVTLQTGSPLLESLKRFRRPPG